MEFETPMPHPPPFVDIHCHLLPHIDDGAADWEELLAMAHLAVADGIETIIATPHQLGAHPNTVGTTIRENAAVAQQFLDERGVPLRVLPGAEIRVESDILGMLRSGRLLTLADRHRHVLLELPHDICLPLGRLAAQLHTVGITPIVAHPERNRQILRQRNVLRQLVDAGCLLQVTSGSLTGAFGSKVSHLAQWMVEQGLVHFVGTDAHGIKRRRPLLGRAFQCVAALVGEETAVDLFCRHPARVVDGNEVASNYRKPRWSGWSSWFQRRKAA